MDWKVDLNMQRYIGEPTPKRLMEWDGTVYYFWRFSPLSFSFSTLTSCPFDSSLRISSGPPFSLSFIVVVSLYSLLYLYTFNLEK